MTEHGGAHPISRGDLEKHMSKVEEKMSSVVVGERQRESLYTLVKDIGEGGSHIMDPAVQQTITSLQQGYCLFYEMHAVLEDKLRESDIQTKYSDKVILNFANAYASFASAALIAHELDMQLSDKEPVALDREEGFFTFRFQKDAEAGFLISRHYGLLNARKKNDKLKEGIDVARSSLEFYRFLRDTAAEVGSASSSDLADLVKDTEFIVDENFTFKGFEARYEDSTAKAHVQEFVPVQPHEVAGNTRAKREMLRDMDRIALFDLVAGRNPVVDVGGLSWSVLYDGLPGTGKTTLFRMGLTRLNERVEQVNEYWAKNGKKLFWKEVVIDGGVKDKYYGETGQKMAAQLSQTHKTDGIYIATCDDIDLLVSGDRNESSGGADKDILNALMQHLDGMHTVVRGNSQFWGATNDATAMDPALRQRLLTRYPVDGPEEWFDYADILYIKLKKLLDNGIIDVPLGYEPFTQRSQLAAAEYDITATHSDISLKDVGELAAEMKQQNPRFTGRSINAVAQAATRRMNNYDIPEEWFVEPSLFLEKPFEERVSMIQDMARPVTGDMMIDELRRYFESDNRYATDKFESEVGKTIHQAKVREEAARRIMKEKNDDKR